MGIEGNGNVTKEKRIISDKFTKVEVSHGIELIVEQGENIMVEAVSYTHLDVYKRQHHNQSKITIMNKTVNINIGGFCLLYTSRCV